MTIKSRMIKTVSRSQELLGASLELVLDYVKSRQNPDGGFSGRSAESDLYYTVFGNNILSAFDSKPNYSFSQFISSVKNVLDSDFINICSYINLISSIADFETMPVNEVRKLLETLESYRTPDGGYSVHRNNLYGSAYGCFLAYSAYENIGINPPETDLIINCLNGLCANDGGYSNEPSQKEGSTTATAAAIVLFKKLKNVVPDKSIDWLLSRFHKAGGFIATPATAIPDLLSTATALFALKFIACDVSNLKESCLDFLDSLWDGNGAFRGHWFDDKTDVEYTFYGLLSIGCIAD